MEKAINEITECLQKEGVFIAAIREFANFVVIVADNALRVHGEIQNEEIKSISQVQTTLCNLNSTVKKASEFLDTYDDIVRLCSGSKVTAAKVELCHVRTVRKVYLAARTRSEGGSWLWLVKA